MAHLYIHRSANASTRGGTRYILDFQVDVMSVLPTRLVCPISLRNALSMEPVDRVHLSATIDDQECVLFLSELTAVASANANEHQPFLTRNGPLYGNTAIW